MSAAKNKVAFPYRVAELDILFDRGIDSVGSVLQAAVENSVVQRKGAWYAYQGTNIGQGKDNCVEALRGDEALLETITEDTIAAATLAKAPPEVVQKVEAAREAEQRQALADNVEQEELELPPELVAGEPGSE